MPRTPARRLDESVLDTDRLAAVARSGLLDSPAEASFDRATRLATRLLGVPVSMVSIITPERQFFKSELGLPDPWSSRRETPLSHSFCQHVVAGDAPLGVRDAREHELVADNRAVEDLDVIAYLGVPVRDDDGNALGALCAIGHEPRDWSDDDLAVLEDLSEMLRTELRLRSSSRELAATALDERVRRTQRDHDGALRFTQLATQSTDTIFVVEFDPEPELVYLNPAVEELTGYARAALLQHPELVAGLLHDHDRARLAPLLREQTGTAVRAQCHRADGTTRWVEVSTAVLADEAGAVRLVQGVVRDVDRAVREREALEHALAQQRQAADDARRVSELQSTFLTAISHEIRTPLTTVVGFAELLAGDRPLDARQTDMAADRLRANARELQRLLLDVLDLDDLANQALEPTRQLVELGPLLTRLAATTGSDRIEVRPTDATVHCDAVHVERIVGSLLDNALRHTPADAPVWVEVTDDGTGRVAIEVGDGGNGIADEHKQRVFRPFTHGPEAARAPNPGVGLGLTLARELALLNGGNVTLEDSQHGGALLTVRLPGTRGHAGRRDVGH